MYNWKDTRNYRRFRDENGNVIANIIYVDGEEVAVSDEVYEAYASMDRRERYLEERDNDDKPLSVDALLEEGYSEAALCSAENLEDMIADKLLVKRLHAVLETLAFRRPKGVPIRRYLIKFIGALPSYLGLAKIHGFFVNLCSKRLVDPNGNSVVEFHRAEHLRIQQRRQFRPAPGKGFQIHDLRQPVHWCDPKLTPAQRLNRKSTGAKIVSVQNTVFNFHNTHTSKIIFLRDQYALVKTAYRSERL